MHITGNNSGWWNRGNCPDRFGNGNGHGVSPDFHHNRNATTGLGFDYERYPARVNRLVGGVLPRALVVRAEPLARQGWITSRLGPRNKVIIFVPLAVAGGLIVRCLLGERGLKTPTILGLLAH